MVGINSYPLLEYIKFGRRIQFYQLNILFWWCHACVLHVISRRLSFLLKKLFRNNNFFLFFFFRFFLARNCISFHLQISLVSNLDSILNNKAKSCSLMVGHSMVRLLELCCNTKVHDPWCINLLYTYDIPGIRTTVLLIVSPSIEDIIIYLYNCINSKCK